MKNGPYELVKAPNDYPGKRYRGKYVYEHHLVWWQNTGELVPEGYTIHHKNGKKRDNSICNLELLTRAQHAADHQRERRMEPDPILNCSWCLKEFTYPARNYRYKKKHKDQKHFFCSRSCSAKYQFNHSRVS